MALFGTTCGVARSNFPTPCELEGVLHEEKIGRLGLCDPKATKTNFLCKWIVKGNKTCNLCLYLDSWQGSTHNMVGVGG